MEVPGTRGEDERVGQKGTTWKKFDVTSEKKIGKCCEGFKNEL